MSFSKAKLQRFNDIKECTPSPANYHVRCKQELKYATIAKNNKLAKKFGSPLSSEAGSIHSTPCFQTPTVPKKKKFLTLGGSSKKPKALDYHEELREKTVECKNKDTYIKDLTEQIEEMTGKIAALEAEKTVLETEKQNIQSDIKLLAEEKANLHMKHTKEITGIKMNIEELNEEISQIKIQYKKYKEENLLDLNEALTLVSKFDDLFNDAVQENRQELQESLEQQLKQLKIEYEKNICNKLKELENAKNAEIVRLQAVIETFELKLRETQNHYDQELKCIKEDSQLTLQMVEKKHLEEINAIGAKLKEKNEEIKKYQTQIEDNQTKINILEENFKDVSILSTFHMKDEMDEMENSWKMKLKNQEKEAEAILKECQAISEYNIIQCEIEKNQISNLLKEKEAAYQEMEAKFHEFKTDYSKIQTDINNLKTEKHAYEISINTFRETIEVLKKRLINSDRDVEQLKEELAKIEEKNLEYENKIAELTNQLRQSEIFNEDLEILYESTSSLMQNKVEMTEKKLLGKVDQLKSDFKSILQNNNIDKKLFNEVYEQHRQQQNLINAAQETIIHSSDLIAVLEQKQDDLEMKLTEVVAKLSQETEEAAEIRKKYIEKSGKYDKLSQQFENVLQELDRNKAKVAELEALIDPIEDFEDISQKKAAKTSELYQQNLNLENQNYKLNKMVEKLKRELEDLRKNGKKIKCVEDKENMASPKCLQKIRVESPGPLKEKN